MNIISRFFKTLQQRFFRTVTSNNLIYNTCWEDPRIDRQLLDLDSSSNILMLTSAGCNGLDYLLDNPQKIDSVDINPAQNALLELKKAVFSNEDYSLLWNLFGDGHTCNVEQKYTENLRSYLSQPAKRYWDQQIDKFNSESFYFTGTSGQVARLIYNRIYRKGLYPSVIKLLRANSMEEQSHYFDEIEPQLWTPFSKWLAGRHGAMTLLGVPASQRKMIEKRYQKGMVEFIRKSLRHVFTKLPISDNYFWRVYLTGQYSKDCCPNYLLESNFHTIAQRTERITCHTTSLLEFLRQSDNAYSHFVLLDHQDWMANAQPEKLFKEWKQILDHAQTGARILFLPNFVSHQLTFKNDVTGKLHQQDRVGTYEATHLAIVK